MDVSEALEEYWAVKRTTMKPKTLNENKRILGYFEQYCTEQNIHLEDIKPKVISSYLEYVKATRTGKHGGTVSQHYLYLTATLIKAFLSWCVQDEAFEQYVSYVSVVRIHKPKLPTLTKDIFTKEQIQALLAACDKMRGSSESISCFLHERNRAIVLLLLDTGIRAAELCNLQMKHVSVSRKDPHIRVIGKGDKTREIGLGERCRQELWRYIQHHRLEAKGTTEPVFLSWRKHKFNEDVLFKLIKELGRLANIKGQCSPHIFRHTFSVEFIRHGGDIYKLSKLLGHSSIKTTEAYLKSFNQSDARIGSIHPGDFV